MDFGGLRLRGGKAGKGTWRERKGEETRGKGSEGKEKGEEGSLWASASQ